MGQSNSDILGGSSVYCINEKQLQKAYEFIESDAEDSQKVKKICEKLQTDLSRNEQAALAFYLIDQLLKQTPS